MSPATIDDTAREFVAPPRSRIWRILVVDDELTIRSSLSLLFSSRNVHVETASSIEEALEALQGLSFHLVISDLHLDTGRTMGGGFDLISRIVENDPAAKVGLLTADPRPEFEAEARRRGACAFWAKSLSIKELVAQVRELGIPVEIGR